MERAVRFRKQLRNGASAAARLETLESRVLFSFTFTSLATFKGAHGGIQPSGLVMDAAGNLFGTTARGGTKGYGTIYEVPVGTHTTVTLATFKGPNGIYPIGNLVLDSSGVLWGATTGGGASKKGTIFSFDTGSTGSTITTVLSFNGVNGSFPNSGLITDASGNFYGMAMGGPNKNMAATLFTLSSDGTTFTKLAQFKATDRPTGGLVIDSAGDIFGTTQHGGSQNVGTVFEFPAGSTSSTVTKLASFTGSNGSVPSGSLMFDSNGNIVGTTASGGTKDVGTIFRFNVTANTITTLASFHGTNGTRPVGNLIVDSSGNFFGLTSLGGAHNTGTLFEFPAGSTTGTPIALFSFNGLATGMYPTGPLVVDSGGNLFGTTYEGGNLNRGTVFEFASGGSAVPTEGAALPLSVANLVITQQPHSVKSGGAVTLTVKLEDAARHVLTAASYLVTVSLASGPEGGTLSGVLTQSATSGVLTFKGVTVTGKGKYSLLVSVGGLSLETASFLVS